MRTQKVHTDNIWDEIVVFIGGLGSVLVNWSSFIHVFDVAICALIGTGVSYVVKETLKRNFSKWFPIKNKKDKWGKPPDRNETE